MAFVTFQHSAQYRRIISTTIVLKIFILEFVLIFADLQIHFHRAAYTPMTVEIKASTSSNVSICDDATSSIIAQWFCGFHIYSNTCVGVSHHAHNFKVLSNQCKHAQCISMICNGASFKIENFMAFGLTHKSYSIVRKLLHDTQVYYKAHGPLVFKMVNSFNYCK